MLEFRGYQWVAWAALAACGGLPARQSAAPSRVNRPVQVVVTPECRRARGLRASAQAHLAEGKLDRTIREVARADQLCPAEALDSKATALDAQRELAEQAEKPPAELIALARAARKSGSGVAAQRLLDRAGAAYEKLTKAALTVDPPPLGIYAAGVSWSPDGKWLAVLDGPFASLFDTATFTHRFRFESPGFRRATTAQFSLDGQSVLIELCENEPTTRCDLRVHRLADGQLRCSIKGPRVGWPRVLSADGSALAEGFDPALWDVATCTQRFSLELGGNATYAMAISRDGRWLAAEDAIWDVQSGKRVGTFEAPASSDDEGTVWPSLEFSSDGKLLASLGAERRVTVWTVPEGRRLRRLPALDTRANPSIVSFGTRDLAIATGDDYRPTQGAVWVFDATTGQRRHGLAAPQGDDHSWRVELSPDRSRVVRYGAGPSRAPAELITLASGQRLALPELKNARFAFSPDGKQLALSNEGDPVRILDTTTGSRLAELPLGHTANAGLSIRKPVALSRDGSVLAVGGEELELWDLPRGERRANIPEQAWHLAVSKANQLAAAGWGIHLVDLDRGVLTQSIVTNSRTFLLGFSAAGDRLAAALENETLPVFDARSGAAIASFSGLTEVRDLRELAFAADDRSVKLVGKGRSVLADLDRSQLIRRSIADAQDRAVGPAGQPLPCDPQVFGAGLEPAALAISADCSTAAIGSVYGPVVVLRRDGRRAWFNVAHGIHAAYAQDLGEAELEAVVGSDPWPEWLPSTPVEPLGNDARARLVCRAGVQVLPLEVCEERLIASGITRRLFEAD